MFGNILLGCFSGSASFCAIGIGLVYAFYDPGDGQSAFLPMTLGALGAVVGAVAGASIRSKDRHP